MTSDLHEIPLPALNRAAGGARVEKWVGWAKLLSKFLTVQVLIQALGFLIGILIIRSFAKEEYAYYALALGMQGVMLALSDLGLSSAILAIGGRVWRQEQEMGSLVHSALRIRRVFFLIGAAVGGLVAAILLRRASAPMGYTVGIAVLIGLATLMQLDTTLFSAVLRLHSRVHLVQQIEFFTGFVRLALVSASLLVTQSTVAVLGAAAVSAAAGRVFARRAAASFLSGEGKGDSGYRAELFRLMRAQAPNAIFYCFYGQTTILVISMFGIASRIAEAGALGRLSAGLLIVSNMMVNIVFPAFARCQEGAVLFRRYYQVLAAYVAGGGLLVLLAWLFPEPLLAVLGHRYANLRDETVWMVLSAVLNGLAGVMFGFCASKGWTRGLWTTIPAIIAAQIFAGTMLDLSSVKGALIFGSLPILPALVIYHALALRGLRAFQRQNGATS